MGVKLCKNVQTNPVSQINANNCLEVCYVTPTHHDLNNEQDIKPIEFSDDDRKTPSNNLQQICKTTTVNNGTSLQYEEGHKGVEQYSSSSNLKLKLAKSSLGAKATQLKDPEVLLAIKNSDGHLQYFNEKNLYQPIAVPFSVIKAMLRPELVRQINRFHSHFLSVHSNPKNETYMTWKLLPNGCYLNKVSDGTVIVVTEDKLYDGFVVGDSYKPEGHGTLITMLGTYSGKFKSGKSQGKGVFIQINDNKRVEGFWKDGELQQGKIETQQFFFQGQFKRRIPDGKGQLRLFKKKIQYKGKFRNGLFQDQKGAYICPQYTYKGGFTKGRKNGYGILLPFQKQKRGRNKYSLQKLEGIFEDDKYKGQNK